MLIFGRVISYRDGVSRYSDGLLVNLTLELEKVSISLLRREWRGVGSEMVRYTAGEGEREEGLRDVL